MRNKSSLFGMFLRAAIFAAAVLLVMPAIQMRAQTVTGTINGTVLDASGAAVPNADITVTNQDTGVVRTATSTADGLYSVPSLLPGNYTVEAKAQGFNPVQVKNVVVNVGTETRSDLHLEVGTTTQTVTVTESIPTVETTNVDVSQVMNEDLIKNIPLNARDLQQLSVIQPGVQQTFTSSFGKQVSVGGDRVANNRFLQEGIDLTWTFRTSPVSLASNILMGADAVKEFKVISENPPVEYGELSGGITSTTFKSGTNQFHGTVFEYYRNSALDARNFFDGATVPPLHRHQFGGQIGGPIRKDKTFFFADFEALRADSAASFVAAVPTLQDRTGALPIIQQIFFGATQGGGGVGTVTPLMPACNDGNYGSTVVNGTCNFNSNPDQAVREWYGVAKIDQSFGSKNTLSGTYNMDQSTEFEPTQLAITADDVYMRRQVGTLQDTYIISSNVVNTFRTGTQRIYYAGNLDIYTSAPIDPRLYVNANPAIVSKSPFPQLPSITIPGLQSIGAPALGFNYVPRFIGYTSLNFSDDVNILRGKHAYQFGAQLKRWYDNIENYMSTPRGAISETNLSSFLTNSNFSGFSWWVQNYTDPLNGTTYNSSIARGMRLMSYGVYGEDTYKAKPNLTITYGLRWEYATAPSEEHNRISNLFGFGCTPYNCATPTVGAPWYHPPKNNFAPRVGFNWDPFKKGKTSVRAGAGIFYSEMEDDYWYPGLASQAPFTVAVSTPGVISFPFNNQAGTTFSSTGCTAQCSNTYLNGFLNPPGGQSQILTRETYGSAEFPNFKTPTKYAYNLTIQQDLPEHMTFLIAYVGSQGRHQGRTYSYQDYFPTTYEQPGLPPMVNGVAIPGAVVNPNCTTPGAITCAYWAGSVAAAPNGITGLQPGAQNVNLLNPNTTANYGAYGCTPGPTCLYAPYATDCRGGTVAAPCYNNPNWSNSVGGNITDGNSHYNALQTVLQRPISPGFFARFNYTYASCIADSGDNLPGQYTNGGSAGFPLIYQHSAGRGRCAYLSTHSANLTLTYTTHWGKGISSRFARTAVSDWQLTSQTLVSSGIPFTVSAGSDTARYSSAAGPSGTGGADRPNWAAPNTNCPNPSPSGAVGLHTLAAGGAGDLNSALFGTAGTLVDVNPYCFTLAPPGYLGNVGPLVFTGPTVFNTDLSLRKTIAISESKSFTFSADMFNAFNRSNFSVPTVLSVFSSTGGYGANLGAINSNNPYATVTTSRQFQINGRFTF